MLMVKDKAYIIPWGRHGIIQNFVKIIKTDAKRVTNDLFILMIVVSLFF